MKELQELVEIFGYLITLCSIYERLTVNTTKDSWFENFCQGIIDLEDIVKKHDNTDMLPNSFYVYYDGLREDVVKANNEKTDILETARSLSFSYYYAGYSHKLRKQEVLFVQFINDMRYFIIEEITTYIGNSVSFFNFIGKCFFVIDEYSYDLIKKENNVVIKDNTIYQDYEEVSKALVYLKKDSITIQNKLKSALGKIEKELSTFELYRSSQILNNSMKGLDIEKVKNRHVSPLEVLFHKTPSLQRYFQILMTNGVIEKREEQYLWKREGIALAFFVSNVHAWGDHKIPWRLYDKVFIGINIDSLRVQASSAHFDNESCAEIKRLICQS